VCSNRMQDSRRREEVERAGARVIPVEERDERGKRTYLRRLGLEMTVSRRRAEHDECAVDAANDRNRKPDGRRRIEGDQNFFGWCVESQNG
jgi:hypothetical protein